MTSRRKQIKPIKASCQLMDSNINKDLLMEITIEDTITKLQSNQNQQLQIGEFINEKLDNEELIDNVTDDENKIVDIPMELIVEEDNLEKKDKITTVEDTLEEISKKMNKDEAKILPFQTSGGVDFFKCPLCDQSYICGRESLTIHLQEHQNKLKRDDGKHLCCLCSKELSSNSSLERHLLTHSNHRPFSCYMCDKKFTTNGNLSRHIKTSHNNNETIESSIDEVLKNHQSDNIKGIQDNSNDNKVTKYKRSFKTIPRKEFKSSSNISSESQLVDQNFLSPRLSIEESCVVEPIFKTILPANLNFFPPLLSLNINEFSFFKPNNIDNLQFLQTNPTSFFPILTTENINTTLNKGLLKNKFAQFKSMNVNRRRKRNMFLKKLEFHLNYNRKFKKPFWKESVKCKKCSKVFFRLNNIISHIRKCSLQNSKEPKYCLFRMCNQRLSSKRSLINHVKTHHFSKFVNSSRESPITEPLNLSVKSSKISIPFDISMKSLPNSFKTAIIVDNNYHSNNICPNFKPSITTNSSDGIIDFSSNNVPVIIQKLNNSTISNVNTQSQTTNQFISTSPFCSSSPLSLSNSLKSDWCTINKSELSDNHVMNLDAISPKSDNICSNSNNSTLKASLNISLSTINRCGLENLSTISSSTEFCSSSPVADNSKLKYNIGIKKKNSYKDAPKLITCPMEGCVQKFPWNSSLMRHILTHTAHKPFKCTRCTKCFSTKSNRERHMTRVHGVRINRSKFKSLQAAKASLEDSGKLIEETVDSENGNVLDETFSSNDKDINITELSEEEWIIMDNNDRRAEDISNNLLKLAGQPLVEPNPVRLNNNQISLLDKSISPKLELFTKNFHSNSKEQFYYDNNF